MDTSLHSVKKATIVCLLLRIVWKELAKLKIGEYLCFEEAVVVEYWWLW